MSGNESWEMAAGVVAPELRGAIVKYTGFYERMAAPISRLELFSAGMKLILCFDGSVSIARAGLRPCRHDAFVVGFGRGPVIATHCGWLGCIEIELNPTAARLFVGTDPTLAGQGLLSLHDLWKGGDVSILIDRLRDAPDWNARFRIVDEVLIKRMAPMRRSCSPEIERAWGRIVRSGGRLAVGNLAEELEWSGRYFGERFRDVIGELPKATARRVRYARALGLLGGTADDDLADIAIACGYSDQSHLTREFKEFTNVSPARYRAAHLQGMLGVSADCAEF